MNLGSMLINVRERHDNLSKREGCLVAQASFDSDACVLHRVHIPCKRNFALDVFKGRHGCTIELVTEIFHSAQDVLKHPVKLCTEYFIVMGLWVPLDSSLMYGERFRGFLGAREAWISAVLRRTLSHSYSF